MNNTALRIGFAIGALLILIGSVLWLTSEDAKADWGGGSVEHRSPDAGYDAPFKVRFDNGDIGYVGEGKHSDHLQPNGQEDVNQIYVGANLEISCYYANSGAGAFEVEWDAVGWHNVGNFENKLCVHGRD